MDIHKPKPWRGWPGFMTEIGIIVIGMLIALGAVEVVETLWLARQAEELDVVLSSGARANLLSALRERC
jgi:hypothetical protein